MTKFSFKSRFSKVSAPWARPWASFLADGIDYRIRWL